MPDHLQTIDRQQVVREHLDSAVRMYFLGNRTSAHLLAFAASAILRGVAEARGLKTHRHHFLEALPKPDQVRMRKLLDQTYTYLKHADKDPEASYIAFDPKLTQLVIGAACKDYQEVFSDLTMPMMLFRADWYSEDPLKATGEPTFTPEFIRQKLESGGGAARLLQIYDLSPELAAPLEKARQEYIASVKK